MTDPGETTYKNPGTCENCGDETLVILDDTTEDMWLCKPCYLGDSPGYHGRTVYQATMNRET